MGERSKKPDLSVRYVHDVFMIWSHSHDELVSQLAIQEAQRQTVVVAVTIEEPHGFCITKYTGDWTVFLHPDV